MNGKQHIFNLAYLVLKISHVKKKEKRKIEKITPQLLISPASDIQ
jgi:hypothetical protein